MQLSYNHITIEIIYTITFQDFKSGAIRCNKFKHYEPGAISLIDGVQTYGPSSVLLGSGCRPLIKNNWHAVL